MSNKRRTEEKIMSGLEIDRNSIRSEDNLVDWPKTRNSVKRSFRNDNKKIKMEANP